MKARFILLVLLSMISPMVLWSQEITESTHEVEKIMDEVFSQQDLDLNYDEIYESLLHRLSSPVDINKATEEELRSLIILNENQIRDLVAHRAQNGDLLSPYELQAIPSFDIDLIRRLLPLISVESAALLAPLARRIFHERNNYLVTRYERIMESRRGFTDAADSLHRFHGSPDKFYMRFRVSHPGDFSFGFTLEKDAGEHSFTDYFSFHAQLLNQRKLRNLIIGDFQIQFGQGLIAGGGFGIGKGSETVTSLRKSTLGFMPYSSVRESGFFRGVAATVNVAKPVLLHAFASRVRPDALVETGLEGSYIRSFQQTGLHRNSMEHRGRKAVNEDSYGFVLEYRRRALQAGAIAMTTLWNIPIQPVLTPYNQFDLSGSRLTNAGVFVNYNVANFTFFAEGAQTVSAGTGVLLGTLGSITRSFDISVVARRYARDFSGIYGNGLAENSVAQNESGLYWGWKQQFTRSLALSGYVDLFRFPWMRYRSYSPAATGHELLVRLMWKPSKTAAFFIQGREERKDRNIPAETTIYKTAPATRRTYCVSADYSVGQLSFRTRIQHSTLDFTQLTKGFGLAQDVRYDHRRWGLYLRHVLFDTDDFDNRQYMYEPDMWLAYSFPAYNGSGIRSMAMIRGSLTRHADIWLRWSRTIQSGAESTGSGVDLIEGPRRSEIKVQVRVRI